MNDKTGAQEAPKLKKIFAVRLRCGGAHACGQYTADKIYVVGEGGLSNEEANRLVTVKGFSALTKPQVEAEEKAATDASCQHNTGEK